MNWLLIAPLAFAAWLSVMLFFLALCRAAARADERMLVRGRRFAAVSTTEHPPGKVIALPVRHRPAA